MTASPWPTWFATTASTTRPTARATGTASDDNRSWNYGAEGPADDPDILVLRERQKRNFLATLLLSQGVPMLLAGDEIGRTQRGNNNAYCQDNEISWVDWADRRRAPGCGRAGQARRTGRAGTNQALLEFVRWLVRFRADHPVFRRRRFFQGRHPRGARRAVRHRVVHAGRRGDDRATGSRAPPTR